MPFTVNVRGEPCPYKMARIKKLLVVDKDALLDALGAGLGVDQSLENRENVAAILNQARENVAKSRLALCFAMPFQQHFLRHFDIATKLFRGMSAQEQTVEKRRLPLWEVEVVLRFFGPVRGGWQRRIGFRLHMV